MPLIRRKYKRYPNLVTAMENRPAMYNETVDHIAQEETAGRLLVIRPPQALPVDRVEKNGAPESCLQHRPSGGGKALG